LTRPFPNSFWPFLTSRRLSTIFWTLGILNQFSTIFDAFNHFRPLLTTCQPVLTSCFLPIFTDFHHVWPILHHYLYFFNYLEQFSTIFGEF
jgi:hypothetical protein